MRNISFRATICSYFGRQLVRSAGAPAVGSATVAITGTDLSVVQLYSSDPTVVYAAQDAFYCSSWTGSDYQIATILKVINWPGVLVGKTITAVNIVLYHNITGYAIDGGTLTIREVLRTVVMAQATWNVFSTGNSWGTAGAHGAADVDLAATMTTGTLPAGKVAGSIVCPTSSNMVTTIQDQKDGTQPNNGYLLIPSNLSDFHEFAGPGPGSLNPPVINITYTP